MPVSRARVPAWTAAREMRLSPIDLDDEDHET
jgi:hypothetical protein